MDMAGAHPLGTQNDKSHNHGFVGPRHDRQMCNLLHKMLIGLNQESERL
jgi:hypothetical protein